MAKAALKTGTAVVSWQDELAKEADIAAGMEAGTGGGSWFSLRGGILSFNEAPLPDNQMAVVILDSMIENVYYEGAYNPDAVSPPKCFALGRDEPSMAPHQSVFDLNQEENDTCTGCPRNEWGSAERGRGKACSNRRRMSVIAAGEFTANNKTFTPYDQDHFETSTVALLKLPVTSVKPFASYVQQIAGVYRRPPFGVFTIIRVVPDPKTVFKVVCAMIGNVPDNLLPIITRRRRESLNLLEAPHPLTYDEPEPAPVKRPSPLRGGAKVAEKRAKY